MAANLIGEVMQTFEILLVNLYSQTSDRARASAYSYVHACINAWAYLDVCWAGVCVCICGCRYWRVCGSVGVVVGVNGNTDVFLMDVLQISANSFRVHL